MTKNKIKLALTGMSSAPKLFNALQLAYGLAGRWERIIVIGSSRQDALYQHLGAYSTLTVAKDATPQRYSDLLNLCAGCHKDVIIFSSLSEEWHSGVAYHASSSYYEDVLIAHRDLLLLMRHAPVHIISCIHTRKVFLPKDETTGKRKLNFSEQLIQQSGIEKNFSVVLHIDKHGATKVEKDETGIFDKERRVKLNVHHGCILHDWCSSDESQVLIEIQRRIDRCSTLEELYRLLFDLDLDDAAIISAFTRRRLELSPDDGTPKLEPIQGGLL
jgi:hypothetical protein